MNPETTTKIPKRRTLPEDAKPYCCKKGGASPNPGGRPKTADISEALRTALGSGETEQQKDGKRQQRATRGIKYYLLASRWAVTACAIAFAFAAILPDPASAQTYTVIHNFTGAAGGQSPTTGWYWTAPAIFTERLLRGEADHATCSGRAVASFLN